MTESIWECQGKSGCGHTYRSPLPGTVSVAHRHPFGKLKALKRVWASPKDKKRRKR